MFAKAVLTVRHDGCFTRRLGRDERMTQISSDRHREILLLRAPAPVVDAFLVWLQETRERVEVVERSAEAVVVHTSILPGGVIQAIEDERCTIQWPATFSDGIERYTVLAPDRRHLERLTARLKRLGDASIDWLIDVPVEALDITTSPLADVLATFSPRQLSVLSAAIERGYYDTPRGTTTAELAASFGVSRSTVDEHIRKAERRVLERFALVLRNNPQLAEIATAGPGRPARVPRPKPIR